MEQRSVIKAGRFAVIFSLLLFVAVFVLGYAPECRAAAKNVDFLADYEAVTYDYSRGIVSNQVNTIAQTRDGYIWIGTYAGLFRYDGYKFEKSDIGTDICNVMALFVDSGGRLWIGTNDAGLVCYDPVEMTTTLYTTEEGLASNTIRSICEDEKGHMLIGTITDLSVIMLNGECKVYKMDGISGIRSMTYVVDGIVAGVTNEGIVFLEKNGELLEKHEVEEEGVYYTAISRKSGEDLLLGSSAGYVEEAFYVNGSLRMGDKYITEDVSYYNDIMYDPALDCYFFCAENGMGIMQKSSGEITYLMQDHFNSSVSGIIRDYQGNYWFVSNKQGLIEYSVSPFTDIFVKADLNRAVVNSVAFNGSELYIGTDNGLEVVNTITYEKKHYGFMDRLEGTRIRNILVDSKKNIWISTFGVDGLVEIRADGKVRIYNEGTKGTSGGRFRCAIELSDGTIVAASNMALNFIRDEEVVKTMGKEAGINAPILTMVEKENGDLLAGSDGDGIYVIKDGKKKDRIGVEEGLSSLVVLRIVPVGSGYIYVTSSALFYYDGKGAIRKLDAFPYTNNYDVHITNDGHAWIYSSAGIFVVELADLIENGEYRYYLLDRAVGFTTSLTATSWNAGVQDENAVFLCCTDGVRRVYTDDIDSNASHYFIRMNSLTYDDEKIVPDENGEYVIPAGGGRIQIQPSILNFTLSNPLIHIYLEGAKDEGSIMYQADLKPLDFTNLPYGSYTLHVLILDPIERNALRDETFSIYKKPKFMDLFAVRASIFLVVIGVVAAVVWWIIKGTVVRKQYEKIREAKKDADRANSAKSRFLANMSHEIRTPINTIMGMDEMILRENRESDKEEYINSVTGYAVSIKRASESLLSLVNDILDLSKIESGKMNLVENEYDVAELLKGVCLMIRVRSQEKDLGFTTRIDPSIPRILYADDGKIKQVILNLLTNAVKYTESGSFTLSCDVVERNDKTVTIRYTVSDTGIGIRPEDMDKLFSAFERLEEKRNSGIQGTGLGLDISRQFAVLMGDDLHVESVYGEGSTFYFSVKQKIVDEEPIGTFKEDEEAASGDGAYVPLFVAPDARILVVDDAEMNLMVIKGLLRATRVQIDTAGGGKEALRLIAENKYDIVLLDHMMPEMDGVETVHHIRENDTELKVFALTANAATSGEEYYVSEGFDGYISKPVDGRKLEELLWHNIPTGLRLVAENVAEEENESETTTAIIEKLRETKGIGVEDGIRFCGSREDLSNAVMTFYDTLEENAEVIENAYKEEDYELYTIKVHALKSSARIIGISELSKMAKELEDAGKEGNIDFIKDNNDEMLSIYRLFKKRLAFLDEIRNDSKEGKPQIPEEELQDAYGALREVCGVMDYDSAEMILGSLREYALSPEDDKKVAAMENMLKLLDWEGIVKELG